MISKNIKKLIKSSKNSAFGYLREVLSSLINPEERFFISKIEDIKDPLYRIADSEKREQIEEFGFHVGNKPSDYDEHYLDERGAPEKRAYFFLDKDSAMMAIFSSDMDMEAYIGSMKKSSNPILTVIDPSKLSRNLEMFKDQEIPSLNSVYLRSSDPDEDWGVPSESIIRIMSADEALEEEDDEYADSDL